MAEKPVEKEDSKGSGEDYGGAGDDNDYKNPGELILKFFQSVRQGPQPDYKSKK